MNKGDKTQNSTATVAIGSIGKSGTARDPICGMTVSRDSPLTSVKDGQTFYFCCESCRRKFESPLPPEAKVGVRYTCPMHPEIIRDTPSACPLCGMALEPIGAGGESQRSPELVDMRQRMWIAAAFSLPLLLMSMLGDMHGHAMLSWLTTSQSQWLQFALATPVVFWAGWPLLERGWQSIRHRSLNMFTLIAIGVGAAWTYSTIAVLAPRLFPAGSHLTGSRIPVYFESAAIITALVLIGQVLELRARARTGSALRALLALKPDKARLIRVDGRDENIALALIRVSDRLRVLPGDRIPVDGRIIEGHSAIDESMLSGESMPVTKTAGDAVIGGSINGAGSFIMLAERVGEDTALAHIIRMVSEAQRSRAPIQRLADRVAAIFVPMVLLVALATFATWMIWGPEPRLAHALVNAVAVLIVACPCALGLATPVSIMVASGRGATAGVLIRNGEALETMARVDTLLLDKTGTLTEGKPQLTQILTFSGIDESEVAAIAASLERGSEHPIAAALVRAAELRHLSTSDVEDFHVHPGMGVSGTVAGKNVVLGNLAVLSSRGINTDVFESMTGTLTDQGGSFVCMAIDGRPAAVFLIADPIRAAAKDTIAELRASGLRIAMITGDNPHTAAAVASELNIGTFKASVLPQQKHNEVLALQQQGCKVAMVGDGINDAPALSQADVGIAMASGTDVAMHSASITLIGSDLRGILRARKLSQHTLRNIKQNLFFAFVYNLLGVPIAAGVLFPFTGMLLSPMLAAAAMSLSSVCVIANALRLQKLKL